MNRAMEDIAQCLGKMAKDHSNRLHPSDPLPTAEIRHVIQKRYKAIVAEKKQQKTAAGTKPKRPEPLCFESLQHMWNEWANEAEEGGGYAVEPSLHFWDLLTTEFHFSTYGCEELERFCDERCIFPTLERQITG
jgi:hypothetical protein